MLSDVLHEYFILNFSYYKCSSLQDHRVYMFITLFLYLALENTFEFTLGMLAQACYRFFSRAR
jgi:hypothetical protein